MTTRIETERLRLRDFHPDDLDTLLLMGNDPDVMRYTGEPMPDRSRMEEIIKDVVMADYKKYGYGRWILELKETGELMGFCGLKYLEEEKEVDIGYRMFKKFWGNGYATEAAIPCMEYGFNELNLDHIIAYVHPDNPGSIRVLEKLKMSQTGTETWEGIDYLKFGVTREAWQSK